jgi:hypothetical protein
LATQNPVDLDYKGLSNAGTWFIGRLQTERDKARVIEGLIAAGEGLDKAQIDALLTNLDSRVFLMRDANEDAPVLFRTRWVLSYLRGPLTLPEIARLTPANASTASTQTTAPASVAARSAGARPVVAAGVQEFYLERGSAERYQPHLLGQVKLHFVNSPAGVDAWETRSWLLALDPDVVTPDWSQAQTGGDLSEQLIGTAMPGLAFEAAPVSALRADSYRAWEKQLENYAYEAASLAVFRSPLVGATSVAGLDEADFRARIALALREKRDAAVETLRRKYAPRLTTLQDQIRRAETRVQREDSQLSQQKLSTAIAVGASILGAFLGRKKLSSSNVGRIGSAARNAGRIGRESDDVSRAQESLDVLSQRYTDLQNEFDQESAALQSKFDPMASIVDRVEIKPRKSDIDVTLLALVWVR